MCAFSCSYFELSIEGLQQKAKNKKAKNKNIRPAFTGGYREKPLVTTIKDPTFVKRITESLLNND